MKGKESKCDDVSDTVMKSNLVIFKDKTYWNNETKQFLLKQEYVFVRDKWYSHNVVKYIQI